MPEPDEVPELPTMINTFDPPKKIDWQRSLEREKGWSSFQAYKKHIKDFIEQLGTGPKYE